MTEKNNQFGCNKKGVYWESLEQGGIKVAKKVEISSVSLLLFRELVVGEKGFVGISLKTLRHNNGN